ncbi:MAG: ferrous iron transport protein B [Gammaproteobacteria bacterium]|nr:ferrous iron transport protein B [Gammaproteobacteria bacterium]
MSDTENNPAAELPVIAVIGNPNTGKSTLFNALSGLRQKTANFPGVTVEHHTGQIMLPSGPVSLVDLPGSYSLAAESPDEMVACDVLLGLIDELDEPDAVLVVADSANLRRNLFLAHQILELGKSVVIALNMSDIAERHGIKIDAELLAKELGTTVIPFVATDSSKINNLKTHLDEAIKASTTKAEPVQPEVVATAKLFAAELRASGSSVTDYEAERALIDARGYAEKRFIEDHAPSTKDKLLELRQNLVDAGPDGSSLAKIEATRRYRIIDAIVAKVETRSKVKKSLTEKLDRITNHPVLGMMLFISIMAIVFQAVFSWAGPLMDLIDIAAGWIGETVGATIPPGALNSLLVDGVVAGVGSVVIFLPQIIILFAFIILLEDSGYMARAAFMMDRLMRSVGLSGQSFIPMLSSFACAVPGIMATRVIPNRRDRIATIIAAPFMTCSARLPVYALLIAAFVPEKSYLSGIINLHGLVLLSLYLLGVIGGVLTALVLKRTGLKGPTPGFMIELPPYRWPNLKSVVIRLLDRGKIFLRRAGTVIFSVAVIVWGLVYFPRPAEITDAYDTQRIVAEAHFSDAKLEARLSEIDNLESAELLEQSLLGRMGKTIEPLFRPLGWDWKVSAAAVASFPAREVVVAVLGTIYAVGADVDETDQSLIGRLQNAKHADGTTVFTLPMAIGLMVFYAFCLQCVATIAVMRRETGGWGWPLFAWCYMTGLGYISALMIYQGFS